jgi:hypothetical protein
MPLINLTEEELTKLWEAVNDGAEQPPELAGRLSFRIPSNSSLTEIFSREAAGR